MMKSELNTIPLPACNKLHEGVCIFCNREENYVTNLVIFPTKKFAHLNCYTDMLMANQ